MKHNEMAKWRNQWLISNQRRNHGAISNNGESGERRRRENGMASQ
jgi:hypothetical protein